MSIHKPDAPGARFPNDKSSMTSAFKWFFATGSLALVLGVLPVGAAEAPPVAADPVAEARMMHLATELRCLVCQNQTIADSQAELAGDLRTQIRGLIQQGMTDAQINQYMVDRYGDFVLYRPPVTEKTWLLWFGPGVLVVGGLFALYIALRRRAARIAAMQDNEVIPMSHDDEKRARALLAEEDGGL
jgi:cytochrome c-type biogenesis protein CcmH